LLNLKNHSLDEFYDVVAPYGFAAAEARRLFAHIWAHGRPELAGVRGLSQKGLERLAAAQGPLPRLALVERHRSPTDGFTKYLFRTHDGGLVESVLIPLPDDGGPGRTQRAAGKPARTGHHTMCISSQVGCPLACVFCATGRMGFRRNLETWEILDQVLQVRAEATHPIRGLVFMGQGEPFLNYDNVIRAAKVFSCPAGFGIGAKAITISTAGIAPAILRFAREGWKFRLAISLTAGNTRKRLSLMPIEKKHDLSELMAAVREYAKTTTSRIMLEYVAISGVNCSDEDARELGELLSGLKVRFNIIEVNDATGQYLPPPQAELDRFRTALSRELRQPIVRRYSGGQDVHAGCGMLAAHVATPNPTRTHIISGL
jgi:23S rRNA (adenine2503-C2)-methyltransferase